MGGKQMEGNNRQRRDAAAEAREQGRQPSEVGATQGSSQQRTEAGSDATHQERIDLKREGKPDVIAANTPTARPGSRDADSADRERYPRLDDSDESSPDRGSEKATRGDQGA
ncbi:MAG TPA: hypothetical protein VK928_04675 [Longimicrobiales bacterium]|nr:hypothetical protein [Longimicrobiales bacterium]